MTRKKEVVVVTPLGRGGKGGIDRLVWSVVDRVRLDQDDIRIHVLVSRGPFHIALSPLFLLVTLCRIIVLKMMGNVDVLHVNLASNGSTIRKLIIMRLARYLGIKTVLHLHGGGYRQYWNYAKPKLDRKISKMFSNTDRIVVLGQVWLDFIQGKVPHGRGRIVILPNATPRPRLPHLGSVDGQVHILFLGLICARKGVPQLIEALGRLADLSGWCATIAGDGDICVTKDALKKLGIAGRVSVPGWVGLEDVEQLIARSDILTLPSFDENLPMCVIEGMASGLAIVATSVGAVEDIITNEETGLLVLPGDVDALSTALRRVVTDASLRQRLGAAALAVHRERLDMEAYVRKLTALWREVASSD